MIQFVEPFVGKETLPTEGLKTWPKELTITAEGCGMRMTQPDDVKIDKKMFTYMVGMFEPEHYDFD